MVSSAQGERPAAGEHEELEPGHCALQVPEGEDVPEGRGDFEHGCAGEPEVVGRAAIQLPKHGETLVHVARDVRGAEQGDLGPIPDGVERLRFAVAGRHRIEAASCVPKITWGRPYRLPRKGRPGTAPGR